MMLKRYVSTTATQRGIISRLTTPITESLKPTNKFDPNAPIPKLIRPIGLPQPPNANLRKYRRGNSFMDMFDVERTSDRVRELSHELNQAGVHEMFNFRMSKGKLLKSPESFWRSEKALYFPHLVGKRLLDGKKVTMEESMRGKITIVKMFANKVGQQLVDQYTLKVSEEKEKEVQVINVDWIENKLKSLLFGWIYSTRLRKLVSNSDEQAKYFVCERSQWPFTIREQLKVSNVFTGYLFLVDPSLKIRWFACGGADEDELKTFHKCVRGLQRELEKEHK